MMNDMMYYTRHENIGDTSNRTWAGFNTRPNPRVYANDSGMKDSMTGEEKTLILAPDSPIAQIFNQN